MIRLKLIQNDTTLCDVVEILDENNQVVSFESVASLHSDKKYFLVTRISPSLDKSHHAIRNVQGFERKIVVKWTHGLANDMEGSEFNFL